MEALIRNMRQELADMKAVLFLKAPFLALLLGKMRIGLSREVRTVVATTYGETVVNPDFWRRLSGEAKTFILLHETLHLAFRHPWSAEGRNRTLFNVAADMVVNEMLFQHGYRRAPGNPVTAPLVREMLRARGVVLSTEELRRASSDEVYLLLSSGGARDADQEALDDVPPDLDPPEGEPKDPGADIVQDGGRKPGEKPEDYWRAAVAEAAVVAHQAGTSPGDFQRVVDESLKSRINWRSQLKQSLRDSVGRTMVNTWERSSRRYVSFPGIKRLGVQTVWALVDSSGSITDEILAQFVAEVWGLSKVFRCELRVCPWDAKAYPQIRVNNPNQVRLRVSTGVSGGGGTLLGPVLLELHQMMRSEDVVVILSDGCIGDLKDIQTMHLYRRMAAKAGGVVFVTTGRRLELPRTRLITFN